MKTCPDNHSNPDEAQFCRVCGHKFGDPQNLPFLLLHPELNLRPISEFRQLHFRINRPEYVEDPSKSSKPEYLYMVRSGKIGILYWKVVKRWYGASNQYRRIIPCKYDRIEKRDDMFICYKGGACVYVDLKGNILK